MEICQVGVALICRWTNMMNLRETSLHANVLHKRMCAINMPAAIGEIVSITRQEDSAVCKY